MVKNEAAQQSRLSKPPLAEVIMAKVEVGLSAFLSSLIPRKTGCRRRSSRVHSVNFIWQTITGLSQWQRFISAALKPWSQLGPFAGNRHWSAWVFLEIRIVHEAAHPPRLILPIIERVNTLDEYARRR
jgi:hypothetical protein